VEKTMRGASPEKWIQGVSAVDRICDVAARTLPGRLGAVLYWLPLKAASFVEWGRAHFIPVVERFFAAVPADQTSEAALHQFRLCSKRLRYEMELVAGAFPDEFRTQLYPSIKALQDRLGEINDLATSKAFLQAKIEQVAGHRESASW
jgi:hypothetical protein